jgi:uncharacterized protein (TIGR00251 family)
VFHHDQQFCIDSAMSSAIRMIRDHVDGALLRVRAAPGSRKNEILGERHGALRVAVTAAPEKGNANRAIIDVIASGLNIAKSRVLLVSGNSSRDKTLLVVGVTRLSLETLLEKYLQRKT